MLRFTGLARRLARLARTPFPSPPEASRWGPWRRGVFTSRLRSPWLTARLGVALAVAFGTCFVTGLVSHAIQHPPGWWHWPAHPVMLYRVTQGIHIATGLAAIPLLAAKLWSVYPRLFSWPPVRDLVRLIERGSIAVLVAASLFQLVTGVLDITYWYGAMPFAFIASHFWGAWLAIGALLVHIAVKLPVIRAAFSRTAPDSTASASIDSDNTASDRTAASTAVSTPEGTDAGRGADPADGLSRRGLLGVVGATAGLITLATVGQTVRTLTPISVLAPRVPDIGPQGFPVNTTAAMAAVVASATDPGYRLTVEGPDQRIALSLAELGALDQHTVRLPISCVEGWSANASWTGVRILDLLGLVGAAGDAALVRSLQRGSPYSFSIVDTRRARDELTLLALRVDGEVLHIDHGYPARLIAPNRPGTLQTKWVTSVTWIPS